MKLIFCPKCQDVIKMQINKIRKCKCGKSWGKYLNHIDAIYGGEAIPLGFANSTLADALTKHRNNKGTRGNRFEAFVIPKKCKTFKKVDKKNV